MKEHRCAVCDAGLKDEKSIRWVKCIDLPYKPHGMNCDCELPVGESCYKNLYISRKAESLNKGNPLNQSNRIAKMSSI